MKKSLILLPFAALMLAGCGEQPTPPPTHEHTLGAWVNDASNHWKTCSECNEVVGKAAHVDANNDGKCDECNYQMRAVATLSSIVVKNQPAKVVYEEGDTFDPTGMVVSASYSDGSSRDLNGTEYTISPLTLVAGTTKVTVYYAEGSITKTADVAVTVNGKAPVVGEPFSITLKDTGYDASQYTYALDPVIFTAGKVEWESSGKGSDNKGTFGGVTQQYNPDWYAACPDGIMQFKKGTGYIQNKAGVSGFTKVTIEWQATYSSEDTQYFPTVYAGTSVGPSTKAACDQTAKLNGTKLGVQDGKEGDKERHDVYKYECTYTINATDSFFKIASGTSASYIAKISFSK